MCYIIDKVLLWMRWIFSSYLCWLLHSLKKGKQFLHKCMLLWKGLSTRYSHGHLNTFHSGQLRDILQYTGEFILASYLVKCFGRRDCWKFNPCFLTPTSSRNMATISGFRVLDSQTKEQSYPWTQEHVREWFTTPHDFPKCCANLSSIRAISLKPNYFFVIAKFNPVSTETYAWRHIALPLGASACCYLIRRFWWVTW